MRRFPCASIIHLTPFISFPYDGCLSSPAPKTLGAQACHTGTVKGYVLRTPVLALQAFIVEAQTASSLLFRSARNRLKQNACAMLTSPDS